MWWTHIDQVNNEVWSGGDDSKICVFDIRSNSLTRQKKGAHDAGVTCIKAIDHNLILSGGYDSRLKLWDSRNLRSEVEAIDMPGTVWDIK